ncbi:MAG: flavodoxin family protein [Bacteroidales bacterium]|nr:flavodoxin family protein [Bacteroidales bacterium]MCF8454617.1 flavodoxin family protein [Bacteroidales bacterium]
MKKVLIFNGSPRKTGNTSALTQHFVKGAETNTDQVELIQIDKLDLDYCLGCLRCNMIGKCGRPGDAWQSISEKMDQSDVIVFASPIYFHHVTAQMKKLIDRFRSLFHVQITETGLTHTAVKEWDKEVVLILTLGSPDDKDAQPAINMFRFLLSVLSPGKELHVIKGTRLAVTNQLEMTEDELAKLYGKLKLPGELVANDYLQNRELARLCNDLGHRLTS